MSDYDCTNCVWDINEFGDIKCLNKPNMINKDTTAGGASNLDNYFRIFVILGVINSIIHT